MVVQTQKRTAVDLHVHVLCTVYSILDTDFDTRLNRAGPDLVHFTFRVLYVLEDGFYNFFCIISTVVLYLL